jgi:hypothetical protein
MMLYGLWLLQRNNQLAAGALFAMATAIKVFPVTVFPYLLWRRQWVAASSMAAFVGIFLVLVPAPIRGFERNIAELKTYFVGMVGSNSEEGYGQRGEQNWSAVNQSIIAMTHRLTRPVNYKTSNLILLAVSALIGVAFIAIIPPFSRRTPLTDACEFAILICLMTVASPLARQYYFVWLIYPVTVLVQRAAYDPRPHARKWTWACIALSFGLMALSLPIFPNLLQAIGNNLAATFVIIAALGWHIRNENSSRHRMRT